MSRVRFSTGSIDDIAKERLLVSRQWGKENFI